MKTHMFFVSHEKKIVKIFFIEMNKLKYIFYINPRIVSAVKS